MPKSLARIEQTQTPTTRFPLFAQSGRDAAALWLIGAPFSMAEFRDLRLHNLLAGLDILDELPARIAVFNEAFAQRIGQAIAHAEVRHG